MALRSQLIRVVVMIAVLVISGIATEHAGMGIALAVMWISVLSVTWPADSARACSDDGHPPTESAEEHWPITLSTANLEGCYPTPSRGSTRVDSPRNLRVTRSVALFTSAFLPHVGGVEEVVRQLALQQTRAGDRPIVLTMRWPKNLPASEDIEGVPVRRHIFRLPEPTPRFMLAYAVESSVIQRRVDRSSSFMERASSTFTA